MSTHVPTIAIESLSKSYKQRHAAPIQAVTNLNLNVPAGQVFGFLGPNGAGKTTTIKMICGLITPSNGHVSVNGHDLSRERSTAMCQIGAVLEGTRNIYWRLSAWENLLYFGRLKGVFGKALATHAERLLRELELWERRHHAVRTFSRGMQQKVAIACALIADPPIVLLDEPTLGLDVQAARTVKAWVATLAREQGKTVVLTTHQLDLAQELCDRVAIMRNGQLVADQPLAQLLELFREEHYQLRVRGQLDHHWSSWFDRLTITTDNGDTIVSGPVADQTALHGLIARIRDLGLPLLSVRQCSPTLEEVFVRLTETPHAEHIAQRSA